MKFTTDIDIIGPWVAQRVDSDWERRKKTGIGRLDSNGKLMAGVIYDDWNGQNVMQHIAAEGNWATPWFLGMMFHYPFCQLKVKRVTAAICSTNEKVKKLVEHLGFEYEFTMKKASKKGDLHIYVMWPEKCRYLGDRYTKYFVK